MNSHAALALAALVLLSGCVGGFSLDGGASQSETTALDGTTAMDSDSDSTTTASSQSQTGNASGNVSAVFLAGENVSVSLEVANSPDERRTGLMHRRSLAEKHGMVFVYEDAAPRTFWMKNTYVALDMIFVAANGTVVNVEHATPQPNASESELARYHSEGDAKYVVELPRGFANRTGVEAGTRLVFNGTSPTTEANS
ncbi:DUF192 domain-containing protein [Halorussus halophilus]|uniref:DUF192 domain-containing protein n=1 Tax=Halorussus halophilus TaxID=2650975 RepID=UPI0013014EFC|nr:DUF192 domain-containing protein [Halorussus halophilus]